jgi:hypothetical protein
MEQYTLTFGKYKGRTMDSVFEGDADYVRWLAENSYNRQAKAAANAVIAQAARKDVDVEQQLIDSLRQICRSKKRPGLAAYKYVDFDVRRDYAEIQLCTHNLHTAYGFTEDFHDADWDLVEIKTSHDDLEEYDEEEEIASGWQRGHLQPQRRGQSQGPTPEAAAKIWYPIGSANKLLSTQPMTLAEAVDFLESYLAKKAEVA